KPIDPETYNALPAAEKRKITRAIQKMEGAINNTLQQLAGLDMEAQKKLNQFSQDTADFIVKKYVNEVKRHYKKYDLVLNYLDAAGKDIALNIVLFLDGEGPEESEGETPEDSVADRDHTFYKYQVNVVVDNSRLEGAPVIHETNPTFINLLGRIEKRPVSGGYVTDFTMIKAGSLMKANGGFLMMEADEVLRNPYVYEALKRSLRNREARIEEISELSGMMSIVSLKPAAVPLKVKLVLIGWNHIYHELAHYDDDFTKVFKIRADFDYETESTPETLHQYAQFFKKVIDEEGLPSFDREAVTELLRYAHRIAGDQQRLSLEFGQLVRMIEQGAFWARKGGGKKVGGEHVRKAISAYERRHSLYNDKMKDHIKDNIVNINVSGQRIGEINALSVMGVGDFSFGSPNRITAKTFIGNEDLVNIERKAGLTGPIHDKGSYILEGFFYSVFGEHEPVSFSASLAFEQNYGHIDGDSASSTELYALLSSLARVPIKQGIAVTGSVNQNGEVQAIGGVNEKIEGFFEVCRLKGLTGEQGVMIPKSNAGDLLLKDEVREAVRAGQFHIWTVESIADGVELLMGVPAGERDEKGFFPPDTIYGKVIDHMDEFILRQKAYNHRLDLMHKKRTGGTKSKPKDKEKSPKKKDKTGKKG
nr:ATP-binding protein [Calditrichia bacterium]